MGCEVSRYQQFCQLKRDVRSSSEHLIVGIDVAKEKNHAFFGTATGRTLLKRLIFENDKAGFDRLMSQTEEICSQNGFSKAVFGLEPTGNYHKSLAAWGCRGRSQLLNIQIMAIFSIC